MKVLFSIIISILVAQALPHNSVNAQEGDGNTIGAVIQPSVLEAYGEPGATISTSFTLENTSNQIRPISLYPSSLIPIEAITDLARSKEFDASTWISLKNDSALLAPGESQEFFITINVPENANPGGHYAQVVGRLLEREDTYSSNGARVLTELSVSILIIVPGDIVEEANLNTSSLLPNFALAGQTKKARFSIINTGNIHLLPTPQVTIRGPKNYLKIVNLQPQLILPNTHKDFSFDWIIDGPTGQYLAQVQLLYGNQGIQLVTDPEKSTILPPLWQWSVFLAITISGLFLLQVRRNINSAIAVLKQSERDAEQKHIAKLKIPVDSEQYPEIFSSKDDPIEKALIDAPKDTHQVTQYADRAEPGVTTIIQTKASTIIRSAPQPQPAAVEIVPKKSIKIKVVSTPSKKVGSSSPKSTKKPRKRKTAASATKKKSTRKAMKST